MAWKPEGPEIYPEILCVCMCLCVPGILYMMGINSDPKKDSHTSIFWPYGDLFWASMHEERFPWGSYGQGIENTVCTV